MSAAMHRTPLQTLLAERLQSAKGLGWVVPENLFSQKGRMGNLRGCDFAHTSRNPPQLPFCKGERGARWPNLLRWLGLAR